MNVSLIGMSGAGKSFVGQQVAEKLGLVFIDIDVVLETAARKPLPDIIRELGDDAFIRVEAAATEKMCERDSVLISTGGSVVYSESAMECLRERSRVVYMRIATDTIIDRVSGNSDRESRIVGLKARSLPEIIAERVPLYEQYAHVIVDLDGMDIETATAHIIDALRR